MRTGGEPHHAARDPEREITALSVHRAGAHGHLGPYFTGRAARHWLPAARGHFPRREGPRGASTREWSHARLPRERERERAAVTDHAVWSPRRQVEERARSEVPRYPAAADHPFVEILRRAARHRRPRCHCAPSLELKPHTVHVAIVVEPQALAALAVDEEEEGALLASRAEERGAKLHHEPRHARQHLMDLRHVDGGALGEGAPDLVLPRPPEVAPLGGDLHGKAREGEAESVAETRRNGAPGGNVRGDEASPATFSRRRSASRRNRRGSRGTRPRCGP